MDHLYKGLEVPAAKKTSWHFKCRTQNWTKRPFPNLEMKQKDTDTSFIRNCI